MMLPGQIKNYQLNVTKQGTYKASEVEAFRQKVYSAFCEILSENNALKEKFVSLSDIVSEYNAGKNSIATALIKSQTMADETVNNAKNKADEIITDAERKAQEIYDSKIKEADEYVSSKTAAADECYERAKTELENVLSSIGQKADEYINNVNQKATDIIANANRQAADIVAKAYCDAQKAKDTCDSILERASLALPSVRNDIEQFKESTLELLSTVTNAVISIQVPEDIDFVPNEIEKIEPEIIDTADIPVFTAEEPVATEEFFKEDSPEEFAEVQEFPKEEENGEKSVFDDDKDATDYIFDKFSAFDDIFSSNE